mmetsp:Transcript_27683/g.92598  ORF Transcript_27683/g.92598 Transcript_27683/m.92598 type:complete len:237 (+) Transcript_27683:830-1540(+)
MIWPVRHLISSPKTCTTNPGLSPSASERHGSMIHAARYAVSTEGAAPAPTPRSATSAATRLLRASSRSYCPARLSARAQRRARGTWAKRGSSAAHAAPRPSSAARRAPAAPSAAPRMPAHASCSRSAALRSAPSWASQVSPRRACTPAVSSVCWASGPSTSGSRWPASKAQPASACRAARPSAAAMVHRFWCWRKAERACCARRCTVARWPFQRRLSRGRLPSGGGSEAIPPGRAR